jgi:cytochrome P450
VQHEVDTFMKRLGGRDPTYQDLFHGLDLLDRCITESLRLWPAVANGTFRQLQFADTIKGAGGAEVTLPKGTPVQVVNWSRHRNAALWGADVNEFNPKRAFKKEEVARVGGPGAAMNPQSDRFSPFAHNPRSCLGKNFAQLEMRLILTQLYHNFDFSLAAPYDRLAKDLTSSPSAAEQEFRGVNRGTMGPMDLERTFKHSWGERPVYAMKLNVTPRA